MPLSLELKIEAIPGSNVEDVILDLCHISKQLKCHVTCDFNNKVFLVSPWSDPEKLFKNWQTSINKYINGN